MLLDIQRLGTDRAFDPQFGEAGVGFRVEAKTLDAKWTSNQNHRFPQRERVIRALQAEGGEADR